MGSRRAGRTGYRAGAPVPGWTGARRDGRTALPRPGQGHPESLGCSREPHRPPRTDRSRTPGACPRAVRAQPCTALRGIHVARGLRVGARALLRRLVVVPGPGGSAPPPSLVGGVAGGGVFVNPSGDGVRFARHVGPLDDYFAPYEPERLMVGARHSYELAANWKRMAGNYQEGEN